MDPTQNQDDAAMASVAMQEQHNAIWTPVQAAWQVAKALRTIAELLPSLSAQAADPLYDLIDGNTRSRNATTGALRFTADRIEKAAPLPVTITDEDRQAVFEDHADMQGDMSSRDKAEMAMEHMTEADIAEYAAQMALWEMES